MQPTTLLDLVVARTMDPQPASLLWLLAEGGVPVTSIGSASVEDRSAVAAAILGSDPSRGWLLLDADDQMPGTEQLAATLRGGVGLGVTLTSRDLRSAMSKLQRQPDGLPEDAVRRLGMVVVVERKPAGLRLPAVHYLRPSERDAQGHIQRRPPAVLATWDSDADHMDDFAWGITPELADQVDRSQADLEERRQSRALFLVAQVAESPVAPHEWDERVLEHLAAEPARVKAPQHEPAKPSPFGGGPTDSEGHLH
jgi:hypothetical protein